MIHVIGDDWLFARAAQDHGVSRRWSEGQREGRGGDGQTHARERSRRADTQIPKGGHAIPKGGQMQSRRADTQIPKGGHESRRADTQSRRADTQSRRADTQNLQHHDAAGSDWRRSVGSALEQPAIRSWAEGVLLDGREWRCFSHEWRRMAFWCLFYCRGGCCCRCRCNLCCCTKLQEVVLQICRGVGAINQWQWRCWHISD